jgi:hypothetical protein
MAVVRLYIVVKSSYSFFLSCKANARVKSAKYGARPALFLIFVLFYVFLCCSMYCLFRVFLCIVCVYMCTELLPPGGYPVAVKYIISYTMYLLSDDGISFILCMIHDTINKISSSDRRYIVYCIATFH